MPKFNHDQPYQLNAIRSVVKVFEGLQGFSKLENNQLFQNGTVFSNVGEQFLLNEEEVRHNVIRCQDSNTIPEILREPNDNLVVDEGTPIPHAKKVSSNVIRYPHFCIDMETGTGKTYVYLRSILQLRQQYGLHKFIIVVPSIAIFEGVKASVEELNPEFINLYGESIHLVDYRESSVEDSVIEFTETSGISVLLITPASFNRASNRIFKATEGGMDGTGLPYQRCGHTRPILIIDEPQTTLGGKTLSALRIFNPLAAFRFSATHKQSPNLLYQLTPYDAFERGLVKQVEVIGFTQESNLNDTFLHVKKVYYSPQKQLRADVSTRKIVNGTAKGCSVTLSLRSDLYQRTNNPDHQNNFIVTYIDFHKQQITFENGCTFSAGDYILGTQKAVFEAQMRQTVQIHMEKYSRLRGRGIKVLSLFFIDRVSNYIGGDSQIIDIRGMFDRIFNEEKVRFPIFQHLEPDTVRDAYFSNMSDDIIGNNKEARRLQREAYKRIMKRKYELVSFGGPLGNLSFIFAHSALREGWDNPNVFQICTLSHSKSEIRKRQEIGRGLRLPLIMDGERSGERCFDSKVNILTVIANENYQSFAQTLQDEYQNHRMPTLVDRRRQRRIARRNENIFTEPLFRKLVSTIQRPYEFRYTVNTHTLIEECCQQMNSSGFNFPAPRIQASVGRLNILQHELTLIEVEQDQILLKISVYSRGKQPLETILSIPIDEPSPLSHLLEDSTITNPEVFRDYTIEQVEISPKKKGVYFSNGISLAKIIRADGTTRNLSYKLPIAIEGKHRPDRKPVVKQIQAVSYPIPDFVTRLSKDLKLSKKTILAIFQGLFDVHKKSLFSNPEDFIKQFRSQIIEVLSDQIVETIEFRPKDSISQTELDFEQLLPPSNSLLQNRCKEGGEKCLYEYYSSDSEEEVDFVELCLDKDEKLQYFFKLPRSFTFKLPKIIGNYNPDWAIIRNNELLIRETKGIDTFSHLQFRSEQRKIICGMKLFKSLGVNYRFQSADQREYWQPGQSLEDVLRLFQQRV